MAGNNRAKNTAYAFMISLVIILTAGVLLLIYLRETHTTWGKEIELSVGDEAVTERIETSELSLLPGEVKEYRLLLKRTDGGECTLTLTFVENAPSPLKEFVTVEIVQDDTLVKRAPLKALFEGEEIDLSGDFSDRVETEVLVRYVMLREVGNEAQGASAHFDVLLTASNR